MIDLDVSVQGVSHFMPNQLGSALAPQDPDEDKWSWKINKKNHGGINILFIMKIGDFEKSSLRLVQLLLKLE